MRLIDRFQSALDACLSRWPTAWGGGFARRGFWQGRFASCGEGVRFGDDLTITGFPAIEIGEHTSIMSRSYLYSDYGGRLKIGAHCALNHNVQLGASGGEIVVGDNVLIGPNTILRAADHEFADHHVPIRLQGHRRGRIVVGDNVWLAANVVVTSNVVIGAGCIVGAGGIVTHDLPPMTICVGNPAKPIRSRLPGGRADEPAAN